MKAMQGIGRRGPGLLLLLVAAGGAVADEPAMRRHLVRPGDNLYTLAERELQDAREWTVLAEINGVRDPLRLQPGTVLLLPPRGTAEPFVVAHARGDVQALAAGGAARRVRTGDLLQEGETLRLGAGSAASLRLQDGSKVHLQEGTELRLLHQQRLPGGARRNVLRLERGRVDSVVAPQQRGSGFEVRTPLAAAGVRGTDFGVELPGPGRGLIADVIEGAIAFGPPSGPRTPVPAGQGAVLRVAGGAVTLHPLLPAPVLQAPPRVERFPLTLEVQGVEGARAYRVRLARDAEFVQELQAVTSPDGRLRIETLADGDYFVSVRAIDRHGLRGFEAVAPLRVRTQPPPPPPQAPPAGALVALGPVEIDCSAGPPAEAYLVQVSRQADFGRIEAEATGLPACRWRFEPREPGTYHWRAAGMARTAGGELERGPFGAPVAFELEAAPAVPRPQVMLGAGLQAHWAAQPGVRYVLELAADPGFAQIVQRLETDRPHARLEPAGCRPHYLRMHALGPRGLRSADSAPQRLPPADEGCAPQGGAQAAPRTAS